MSICASQGLSNRQIERAANTKGTKTMAIEGFPDSFHVATKFELFRITLVLRGVILSNWMDSFVRIYKISILSKTPGHPTDWSNSESRFPDTCAATLRAIFASCCCR